MPHFLHRIFKLTLGLLGVILVLVLGLGLLTLALCVLGFSLLKALLTGQRPASPVVFKRFSQFSEFSAQRVWPGRRARNTAAAPDVVDVQAREIEDKSGR